MKISLHRKIIAGFMTFFMFFSSVSRAASLNIGHAENMNPVPYVAHVIDKMPEKLKDIKEIPSPLPKIEKSKSKSNLNDKSVQKDLYGFSFTVPASHNQISLKDDVFGEFDSIESMIILKTVKKAIKIVVLIIGVSLFISAVALKVQMDKVGVFFAGAFIALQAIKYFISWVLTISFQESVEEDCENYINQYLKGEYGRAAIQSELKKDYITRHLPLSFKYKDDGSLDLRYYPVTFGERFESFLHREVCFYGKIDSDNYEVRVKDYKKTFSLRSRVEGMFEPLSKVIEKYKYYDQLDVYDHFRDCDVVWIKPKDIRDDKIQRANKIYGSLLAVHWLSLASLFGLLFSLTFNEVVLGLPIVLAGMGFVGTFVVSCLVGLFYTQPKMNAFFEDATTEDVLKYIKDDETRRYFSKKEIERMRYSVIENKFIVEFKKKPQAKYRIGYEKKSLFQKVSGKLKSVNSKRMMKKRQSVFKKEAGSQETSVNNKSTSEIKVSSKNAKKYFGVNNRFFLGLSFNFKGVITALNDMVKNKGSLEKAIAAYYDSEEPSKEEKAALGIYQRRMPNYISINLLGQVKIYYREMNKIERNLKGLLFEDIIGPTEFNKKRQQAEMLKHAAKKREVKQRSKDQVERSSSVSFDDMDMMKVYSMRFSVPTKYNRFLDTQLGALGDISSAIKAFNRINSYIKGTRWGVLLGSSVIAFISGNFPIFAAAVPLIILSFQLQLIFNHRFRESVIRSLTENVDQYIDQYCRGYYGDVSSDAERLKSYLTQNRPISFKVHKDGTMDLRYYPVTILEKLRSFISREKCVYGTLIDMSPVEKVAYKSLFPFSKRLKSTLKFIWQRIQLGAYKFSFQHYRVKREKAKLKERNKQFYINRLGEYIKIPLRSIEDNRVKASLVVDGLIKIGVAFSTMAIVLSIYVFIFSRIELEKTLFFSSLNVCLGMLALPFFRFFVIKPNVKKALGNPSTEDILKYIDDEPTRKFFSLREIEKLEYSVLDNKVWVYFKQINDKSPVLSEKSKYRVNHDDRGLVRKIKDKFMIIRNKRMMKKRQLAFKKDASSQKETVRHKSTSVINVSAKNAKKYFGTRNGFLLGFSFNFKSASVFLNEMLQKHGSVKAAIAAYYESDEPSGEERAALGIYHQRMPNYISINLLGRVKIYYREMSDFEKSIRNLFFEDIESVTKINNKRLPSKKTLDVIKKVKDKFPAKKNKDKKKKDDPKKKNNGVNVVKIEPFVLEEVNAFLDGIEVLLVEKMKANIPSDFFASIKVNAGLETLASTNCDENGDVVVYVSPMITRNYLLACAALLHEYFHYCNCFDPVELDAIEEEMVAYCIEIRLVRYLTEIAKNNELENIIDDFRSKEYLDAPYARFLKRMVDFPGRDIHKMLNSLHLILAHTFDETLHAKSIDDLKDVVENTEKVIFGSKYLQQQKMVTEKAFQNAVSSICNPGFEKEQVFVIDTPGFDIKKDVFVKRLFGDGRHLYSYADNRVVMYTVTQNGIQDEMVYDADDFNDAYCFILDKHPNASARVLTKNKEMGIDLLEAPDNEDGRVFYFDEHVEYSDLERIIAIVLMSFSDRQVKENSGTGKLFRNMGNNFYEVNFRGIDYIGGSISRFCNRLKLELKTRLKDYSMTRIVRQAA